MKKILTWLFSFFIVFIVLFGFYVYTLTIGLPDVKALEYWKPPQSSIIYDDKGRVIGQIGVQKRVYVPLNKISPWVQKAFISAEDRTFYSNIGIDPLSMVRALIADIKAHRIIEGGSTITQQLAKNLFLTPKKTISRKLKEIILAIEITRTFPKNKILEMYLNQIYLGHGAYGVEAASEVYFDKPAEDLDISEAALLAGLPKAPSEFDPFINMEGALERRNYVLYRMYKDGYINYDQYKKALNEKIVLAKEKESSGDKDYFVDYVKQFIYQKFGDLAYSGGLKIYTTMDKDLQDDAINAVIAGVQRVARIDGVPIVPPSYSAAISMFKAQKPPFKIGKIYVGIVQSISKDKNNNLIAYININGEIVKAYPLPGTEINDIELVKILKQNPKTQVNAYIVPIPQAALVSIDAKTGAVKALVGGYSYKLSPFNRALYAYRQTGSAIKPIIYLSALMKGYTQVSMINAEPQSFFDPSTGEYWTPRNYEGEAFGYITLRKAIALSVNTATVNLLAKIGFSLPIAIGEKLGVHLKPYYSMALGSIETTPFTLTSAYQAFANLGNYCKPYFITKIVDFQGNVIYQRGPECSQVLPAPETRVLISMLKDVVRYGTGAAASSMGRVLAGKTGTTNNYVDAWFEGMNPDLVTGVWVGYDIRKSLGHGMAGAAAALPIWMNYMSKALAPYPANEDWPLVKGVEYYEIDPFTHLLATPLCPGEPVLFVKGTEPTQTCEGNSPNLLNQNSQNGEPQLLPNQNPPNNQSNTQNQQPNTIKVAPQSETPNQNEPQSLSKPKESLLDQTIKEILKEPEKEKGK